MVPLNDDIILLISEYIHDQEDQLRLLQVCRHWYSLLLPRVYRNVWLCNQQIYLLTRSIKSNPTIGPLIRDLTVDWSSGPQPGDYYEVDLFKETLQQTSDSQVDCEDWEYALQQGCPDAWLAVFLLSLESVRSIRMNYGCWSPYFIPKLTQIAAEEKPFDTEPVLQQLSSVTAWIHEGDYFYNEIDFRPFFYLPAMQELVIRGIHTADVKCDVWMEPALGTSGIRKIDMEGLFHGGDGNQIASCANLEVFDYQHANRPVWDAGYFPPFKIYEALLTQRHSLQVLRLVNNQEPQLVDSDDEPEALEEEGFGSLAEFHQLRELRIPMQLLLQFDFDTPPRVTLPEVLPSSLEYLNLVNCFEHDFGILVKNIANLLAQQKERFPNLKKLEVQPEIFEMVPGTGSPQPTNLVVPATMQQAFASLAITCHKMGIQFGFSKHGHCRVV